MFSLAFMLIGSFAFANSNDSNESLIIKKEITSYSIDNKSFSPKEFTNLDLQSLESARECTVTVTVTVQTPQGPRTFTHTETFEASWLGCLAAQVGAFIAGLFNPSI